MSITDKTGIDGKKDEKRKGKRKPKTQRHAKAIGMSSVFVSIYRNGQKDNFRQLPPDCVETLDYLHSILQETIENPACFDCNGRGKIYNRRKEEFSDCKACKGSGKLIGFLFQDVYRVPLNGKTIGAICSILKSRLQDCKGIAFVLPNVKNYENKNYGKGTISPISVGSGKELPAHARGGALRRKRYNEMKPYFKGWNFLNSVYFGVPLTEAYQFTQRHLAPFMATMQAICDEMGIMIPPDWHNNIKMWVEVIHEWKEIVPFHTKRIKSEYRNAVKANEQAIARGEIYYPSAFTYWDEINNRLEQYLFHAENVIDIDGDAIDFRDNKIPEFADMRYEKQQKYRDTLNSMDKELKQLDKEMEEKNRKGKKGVYTQLQIKSQREYIIERDRLIAIINGSEFGELSSEEQKHYRDTLASLKPTITSGDILPVVEAFPNSQTMQRESAKAMEEFTEDELTDKERAIKLGKEYKPNKPRIIPVHSIAFVEPLPPKFVTALVGTKREIRDRHLELTALRADYDKNSMGEGI
jgi:hypothetical protein